MVGNGVADIKTGNVVACVPCAGCGRCQACDEGRFFSCSSGRAVFGGFGDYVAVPRRNAVLLPRTLSLSDGALVEPIACGLHALRLASFRAGDRVPVIGAGPIATAVVCWARILGAGRIVVVSRSVHRRDVLLPMGADALLGFDEGVPDALVGRIIPLEDLHATLERMRAGEISPKIHVDPGLDPARDHAGH